MIVLKHKKQEDMAFVSHIDMMRVLQRGVLRAKIDVKMSGGYNPHLLTFCTQPLPLGVQSFAEYLVIDNEKMGDIEVFEKLKVALPFGLELMESRSIIKNPNIAGKVIASEYRFKDLNKSISKEILTLKNLQEVDVEYLKKGEVIKKNIADMIFDIDIEKDEIVAKLAFGNVNLRADIFAEYLNKTFKTDIIINNILRVSQIVNTDKYTTVDQYLEETIF